jgi:hypothetical protein
MWDFNHSSLEAWVARLARRIILNAAGLLLEPLYVRAAQVSKPVVPEC